MEELRNVIDVIWKCPSCCSAKNHFEDVTFKNGTKHVRRSCGECSQFINWVSQEKQFERFEFGKHIGETLEEVFGGDPQYLCWASENFKNANIRFQIAEFLRGKETESDGGVSEEQKSGQLGVDQGTRNEGVSSLPTARAQ